MRNFGVLVCLVLWEIAGIGAAERPNFVVILADDMGYGDPRCFNPESRLSTPFIDQIAREGLRFTDAHAAGAVCIPSRYGLLTGHYPWRGVTNGRINAKLGPVIHERRLTLPGMLQQAGYRTAMIGKWHQGFVGGENYDFTRPFRGGPVDRGFHSFLGVHASTDIPPYFLIRHDRVVTAPTQNIAEHHSPDWSPIQGAFWRSGQIAPDLQLEQVLPLFIDEAEQFLSTRHPTENEPFLLYLALTAPHTPWLPTKNYRGTSEVGLYGDFVKQVDDSVGRILKQLDRQGLTSQTVVCFSSDNGPVWYPRDAEKYRHSSTGPFRGMKGDAWEGGHRVPLIVSWPGKVPQGGACAETVCLTDLMATFAAMLKIPLPEDAAEDSVNLWPLLAGAPRLDPPRSGVVHLSSQGVRSLRVGDWKWIPQLGSGGFTRSESATSADDGARGQLYNLRDDPQEQHNRWKEHPEIVQGLTQRMNEITRSGRSR